MKFLGNSMNATGGKETKFLKFPILLLHWHKEFKIFLSISKDHVWRSTATNNDGYVNSMKTHKIMGEWS